MNKKLLFMLCLLTFSFAKAQLTSVALVGSGTTTGWPTGAAGEVDATVMNSVDTVHWTLNNVTLLNGAVKFRGNNSWALPYNWGGPSFPTGTGVLDGNGFTSVAGIYNVTFNSTTGDYSFVQQQNVFQVISIFGDATPGAWTTDTDMSTLDGNIYTLNRVSLVPGALKFRGDHAWTLPYNWGGTAFPSGTAVVDANGITIPAAGLYNITFNKTTFAYSFTFQVVSIFGDATPGSWTTDTDMTTTDGFNYAINNVALLPGALKFRGDHSWTLPYNWGGTAFPSGTAVVDANGITIPAAGNYNITFNTTTAVYNFTDFLATTVFNKSNFKVYPNPTKNEWNFTNLNDTIENIQILDVLGKTIINLTQKSNSIIFNASELNDGIYFARVTADNSVSTIKLIKN
jgi:hypothetical protein